MNLSDDIKLKSIKGDLENMSTFVTCPDIAKLYISLGHPLLSDESWNQQTEDILFYIKKTYYSGPFGSGSKKETKGSHGPTDGGNSNY